MTWPPLRRESPSGFLCSKSFVSRWRDGSSPLRRERTAQLNEIVVRRELDPLDGAANIVISGLVEEVPDRWVGLIVGSKHCMIGRNRSEPEIFHNNLQKSPELSGLRTLDGLLDLVGLPQALNGEDCQGDALLRIKECNALPLG